MQKLYRIIDANLNRSREGIRVIEDIVRFCIDDAGLSRGLKKLRHEIAGAVKDTNLLIASRNSQHDVGKRFTILPGAFYKTGPPQNQQASRQGGKKLKGLAVANFRRVEESLRVLEEVYKIVKPSKTEVFKNLRFKTYTLEKKVYERL